METFALGLRAVQGSAERQFSLQHWICTAISTNLYNIRIRGPFFFFSPVFPLDHLSCRYMAILFRRLTAPKGVDQTVFSFCLRCGQSLEAVVQHVFKLFLSKNENKNVRLLRRLRMSFYNPIFGWINFQWTTLFALAARYSISKWRKGRKKFGLQNEIKEIL